MTDSELKTLRDAAKLLKRVVKRDLGVCPDYGSLCLACEGNELAKKFYSFTHFILESDQEIEKFFKKAKKK